MEKDGCDFMINNCTKFYSSVYIDGWFGANLIVDKKNELLDVELNNCNPKAINKNIGFEYPGLLSKKNGFRLQVFFANEDTDIYNIEIVFVTNSGKRIYARLGDLMEERLNLRKSHKMQSSFMKLASEKTGFFTKKKKKMLDIGGRDRSGLDRSKFFPDVEVTVLDILEGQNVDVVGDAHELSKYFKKEYFDVIYSFAVFEHLLQPWKVALEMNKVLKKGGIGFIFTHQTIGMHDLPWDYFRFSDSAWDGIFNKYTGFEIIDRSLDFEQYILPFILRPGKEDAEKSVGFEGSTVLVKKISNSNLSWDVQSSQIVTTNYPDKKDSQILYRL